MAYNLVQIPIVDLQPSTALGVSIPFSDPGAFTSVYTTLEQTKYNIINFMLTDRRERPFNPNFGAGLRSRLFEQITQDGLDNLKLTITNQIQSYFPNVVVNSLDIIGDPDNNEISIQLTYSLKNIKSSDSLTLKIQNA
jgi:phage baseplate assembly protein W